MSTFNVEGAVGRVRVDPDLAIIFYDWIYKGYQPATRNRVRINCLSILMETIDANAMIICYLARRLFNQTIGRPYAFNQRNVVILVDIPSFPVAIANQY